MQYLNEMMIKNPNATTIEMDYKQYFITRQITDLGTLLSTLSKFKNLRSLNLHGNRIKQLPRNLSEIGNIRRLDISNNLITNIDQMISSLKSIPQLDILTCTLKDHQQDKVIAKLNLSVLNGKPLRREEKVKKKPQTIGIDQTYLENVAKVYDEIRDLFLQRNYNCDKMLADQFDEHIKSTMARLAHNLKKQGQNEQQSLKILQGKKQIYVICEQKVCNYLQSQNSELKNIIFQILKNNNEVIKDLITLNKTLANHKIVEQPKENKYTSLLKDQKQFLEKENQKLNQENKKFMDIILRHSKGDKLAINSFESSYHQPKSPYSTQPHNLAFNSVYASEESCKHISSLKQMKQVMWQLYNSKRKYDQIYYEQKKLQSKKPRETMQQHMYTFLNKKYGLKVIIIQKNLIIEYATSIISGVKKYSSEDIEVAVFGKILKNQCQEEFRFVIEQVKQMMKNLLQMYLKSKMPLKSASQIKEMLQKKINGYLNKEQAQEIVKYIFSQDDAQKILQNLQPKYVRSLNKPKPSELQVILIRKKMTRQEQLNMHVQKEYSKVEFHQFQSQILCFQLKSHDKLLQRFVKLFNIFDINNDGILTQQEFRKMLEKIGKRNQKQIQKYLAIVDPYNTQQITFSTCVTAFSSDQNQPNKTALIHILNG